MRSVALLAVCVLAALAVCEASQHYPNRHLPDGNTTVIATQQLVYGGLYMVTLGRDGQLWRIYQRRDENLTWVDWAPLTKACPWANNTARACIFDADPALARNSDGRLELFARFHNNLDLWQMYMTDPLDPESWTTIREPSCVDQDQKTGLWACLCPPVDKFLRCKYPSPNYWVGSPIFPTSDIQIINAADDGRIQLIFRGFDGQMYMSQQVNAGDSSYYTSPIDIAPGVIFE